MMIKFLTFNIHKGLDWKNKNLTLNVLRSALENLNPDIIFLQEIVGENKVLEKKMDEWITNQVEYLAEGIWHNSAYSEHAIFDHRNHGNAILSKFPIIKSEVHGISLNPLEQRAILFADIELPHTRFHCYCTHLNLLHRDRIKQYQLIRDFIYKKSPKDIPIAFAGDFNDWNQKASIDLFDLHNFHDAYQAIHKDYAKTFPSFLPWFKLDRFYTTGIDIMAANVLKEQPWNSISDHLPIFIEAKIS